MEKDNVGFTVSPATLSLNPNPLYDKYYAQYPKYFESSNNLRAIEIFCQSNTTTSKRNPKIITLANDSGNFLKNTANSVRTQLIIEKNDTFLALLPMDIQLKILEYCNLSYSPYNRYYLFNKHPYAFIFLGFLNHNTVYEIKNKTFHFKDFDVQPKSKNYWHDCKIVFKQDDSNPDLLVDPTTFYWNLKPEISAQKICTTLEQSGLVRIVKKSCNILERDLFEYCKEKPKNHLCRLAMSYQFFGIPFTITPLFHQKVRHSQRFYDYSKQFWIDAKEVMFYDFVKHCFFLKLTSKSYLIIAELISIIEKNGNKQKNFYCSRDSHDNAFLKNHRIEIYIYDENKTEYTLKDAIQVIPLPFLRGINKAEENINYEGVPYNDSEKYFRYIFIDVFRDTFILYDKKRNLHGCFSLPSNKYVIYEDQSKYNKNLDKATSLIFLKSLPFIIKEIERDKAKRRIEAIKRSIWEDYAIPAIISVVTCLNIYLLRHLLYNNLKAILRLLLKRHF
ncbi:MAG TPA: hypothetical protein VL201_05340 [Patescibacteria group bacterium]|jgi:hypothetical protein|nr:hypothetical protein [Patescibacteria group bacterium]